MILISNIEICYHNAENPHLFFEMFLFKNKKFEIKVKFFVNIMVQTMVNTKVHR